VNKIYKKWHVEVVEQHLMAVKATVVAAPAVVTE
jgi:hypothetical protein